MGKLLIARLFETFIGHLKAACPRLNWHAAPASRKYGKGVPAFKGFQVGHFRSLAAAATLKRPHRHVRDAVSLR